MAGKYFDHLTPREYRGVTVEAKVATPRAAITVLGGPPGPISYASWGIRVGDTWVTGFPAAHDDTEVQVWGEIRRRVDRLLDDSPTADP